MHVPTGSPDPEIGLLFARALSYNKLRQSGLNHDYNMVLLISAYECQHAALILKANMVLESKASPRHRRKVGTRIWCQLHVGRHALRSKDAELVTRCLKMNLFGCLNGVKTIINILTMNLSPHWNLLHLFWHKWVVESHWNVASDRYKGYGVTCSPSHGTTGVQP